MVSLLGSNILGSFKIFLESLYFLETQNNTNASDSKYVVNIPRSNFVKAFSALPFVMMSLTSQKLHPIIADCSVIVKKSDFKFEHSAWNFELFVSIIVTMSVLKVERALVSRSCSCLVDIPTPTSVVTILPELLPSHSDITVPSVSAR